MSNFPTPNDWALALQPLFNQSNKKRSSFDPCFKELTALHARKDALLKQAQRSNTLTVLRRNTLNHAVLRKSLEISAEYLGIEPQLLLIYIYEESKKESLVEI